MARHVPSVDLTLLAEAVRAGDTFLSEQQKTTSRDEYHRVVLSALGIAGPSEPLLRELDLPLTVPVFDVFPEVPDVLSAVRERGIPMAVVSDSWGTSTTMLRLFDQVGLSGFFDVVVVSEELGCRKPDPRMFDTAASTLGFDREACLFVDDDADLVAAAIDLGYRGTAVVREGPFPRHVPSIRILSEMLPFLA